MAKQPTATTPSSGGSKGCGISAYRQPGSCTGRTLYQAIEPVGQFSPLEGELGAFKAERDGVLQLRPLWRVELCLFAGLSGF
jgi:hypothetical protein